MFANSNVWQKKLFCTLFFLNFLRFGVCILALVPVRCHTWTPTWCGSLQTWCVQKKCTRFGHFSRTCNIMLVCSAFVSALQVRSSWFQTDLQLVSSCFVSSFTTFSNLFQTFQKTFQTLVVLVSTRLHCFYFCAFAF